MKHGEVGCGAVGLGHCRETDSHTKSYYCDIYDTAPETPGGLNNREVNEFHDKVPFMTGYAICGRLEYGCGYFRRRHNAYVRMLRNLSQCLCATAASDPAFWLQLQRRLGLHRSSLPLCDWRRHGKPPSKTRLGWQQAATLTEKCL